MVNQHLEQSLSVNKLRSKLIDLVTEMIVVREEIQKLEEQLETPNTKASMVRMTKDT